ncbi:MULTISPECIES: hypothetical protein [Myxococcus]|uniref:hypothetical protein n=1 Tax=Myxococcus TaxID=32 RepID=UPI0013D634E2|nr:MULTISPECIES: hypothetical protein [Myxococcus]NVJ21620.1 hypothetical protein [Myxococcus sp. AM011]
MAGMSIAVMFSMGVLLGAGEGVVEPASSAEPRVSGDDTDFRCTESYWVYYYSDSTYVTLVGEGYCQCNRIAVLVSGRTSQYTQYSAYETCLDSARDYVTPRE